MQIDESGTVHFNHQGMGWNFSFLNWLWIMSKFNTLLLSLLEHSLPKGLVQTVL